MQENPILVVGSGRLAHHLRHYLKGKSYSFGTWSRKDQVPLTDFAAPYEWVCLAVSDDALIPLAQSLRGKKLIHFSGAKFVPGALGIHPLMTFGEALFSDSFYDQIPLIFDDSQTLKDFSFLPNPKSFIDPEQKGLYHGLCHLAGNYPKFLWIEIAKVFGQQLNLDPQILKPFLEEILRQSFSKNVDVHTGAFARKDLQTINAHLAALQDLASLKISYEGFLNSYKEVQP